jgi:hypothetical protein
MRRLWPPRFLRTSEAAGFLTLGQNPREAPLLRNRVEVPQAWRPRYLRTGRFEGLGPGRLVQAENQCNKTVLTVELKTTSGKDLTFEGCCAHRFYIPWLDQTPVIIGEHMPSIHERRPHTNAGIAHAPQPSRLLSRRHALMARAFSQRQKFGVEMAAPDEGSLSSVKRASRLMAAKSDARSPNLRASSTATRGRRHDTVMVPYWLGHEAGLWPAG